MLIGQRCGKLRGLQNALSNLFDEIDVRKKRSAGMLVRIQNTDLLLQIMAYQSDRLEQIGVVRYHHTNIEFRRVCIVQQVSCQIYIRPFFLGFDDIHELQRLPCRNHERHPDGMRKEMPEVH